MDPLAVLAYWAEQAPPLIGIEIGGGRGKCPTPCKKGGEMSGGEMSGVVADRQPIH